MGFASMEPQCKHVHWTHEIDTRNGCTRAVTESTRSPRTIVDPSPFSHRSISITIPSLHTDSRIPYPHSIQAQPALHSTFLPRLPPSNPQHLTPIHLVAGTTTALRKAVYPTPPVPLTSYPHSPLRKQLLLCLHTLLIIRHAHRKRKPVLHVKVPHPKYGTQHGALQRTSTRHHLL